MPPCADGACAPGRPATRPRAAPLLRAPRAHPGRRPCPAQRSAGRRPLIAAPWRAAQQPTPQVAETLPADVLSKMHAAPKAEDVPVIDPHVINEVRGWRQQIWA